MIRSGSKAPTISVLLLLTWGVHQPAAGPTDTGQAVIDGVQSTARTDENSRIAHQQLLEKRKKGRIDVYFTGDSITRRWGTSDAQYKDFLANWTENFFGWNAANFGWGGDTVQNVLWRLQNGELDDVHPKVIVLLAGANNLAHEQWRKRNMTTIREMEAKNDARTWQEAKGDTKRHAELLAEWPKALER